MYTDNSIQWKTTLTFKRRGHWEVSNLGILLEAWTAKSPSTWTSPSDFERLCFLPDSGKIFYTVITQLFF